MRSIKGAFTGAITALAVLLAFTATVHLPVHALDSIHASSADHGLSIVAAVHADEPAPTASAAPAEPSAGSKIGDFLEKIAGAIPSEGAIFAILAFVYDFARRRWPTKDPSSLWRDAKKVLSGLMALLSKLDQFGDKIFGQKTK